MKQKSYLSFHKKAFIVLFICLCVPFIATWTFIKYMNESVFIKQKGEHLISITKILDERLGEGGFDAILMDADAVSASPEEKVAVLNEALEKMTDGIANVSEGLGVGYYSLELEAILTYGPSEEFGHVVGQSVPEDHPGRSVMDSRTQLVEIGSMVRGDILSALYPIIRDGEVIGFTWANELMSELAIALQSSSNVIFVFLWLAFFMMIVIIIIFLRKVISLEQESRFAVEEASKETKRLDKLMHIVNNSVSSLLTADEDSFEEVLQYSMQTMAMAFEVERVSVWKYNNGDMKQKFQLASNWYEKTDVLCKQSDFEKQEFVALSCSENWEEQLIKNQIVKVINSQVPVNKSILFGTLSIQSIMSVPVFLQEQFWGFVSFCNCESERDFTSDEEAILLSGSLLMANAIYRNEMIQRLVLAREEALSGTKAKSSFLASMSHEMRTPMNAIIGMTSVGKTTSDVERKDYAFEKIEDASIHLLGIINDVLDLSKIESGKLELSPVTFQFEKMLERVLNVINHRFEEKEQNFIMRIDEQVPKELICDDQRIIQVITNLLSNAIKFTPQKGSIRLEAHVNQQEDDNYKIQIDVSDTGIGISAEQKKRIFNSFEQAESSTTRKYGGTGLGLSISKNIVELLGGEIWIKSNSGRGSTFSFTFCAKEYNHFSPLQDKTDEWNDQNKEKNDYSEYHILLVEDVEINREVVMALLEPTGIGIDCAENGIQAVQMFRDAPDKYSMIFMDIQMPEMDGHEATQCIRKLDLPAAESIPIIAITANVFKEDIDACIQSGMNDHIGKPLSLDELMSKLWKYLK